jgi:hypothetical protein
VSGSSSNHNVIGNRNRAACSTMCCTTVFSRHNICKVQCTLANWILTTVRRPRNGPKCEKVPGTAGSRLRGRSLLDPGAGSNVPSEIYRRVPKRQRETPNCRCRRSAKRQARQNIAAGMVPSRLITVLPRLVAMIFSVSPNLVLS